MPASRTDTQTQADETPAKASEAMDMTISVNRFIVDKKDTDEKSGRWAEVRPVFVV